MIIDLDRPRALPAVANIPSERIDIETMVGFLFTVLTALGASIPERATGGNYAAVYNFVDETREFILVGSANDPSGVMARLRPDNLERFAWNHVLIDEPQDCRESERDSLRALDGHRRLVLAEGVDQLVRRQDTCDWHSGIPKSERVVQRVETSLRMLRKIATFSSSRTAQQRRKTVEVPALPRGNAEWTDARSVIATLTPPVHAR